MDSIQFYELGTNSLDITGADISAFVPVSDSLRAWFLNANGRPIAAPSLQRGHALVVRLTLKDGGESVWLCGNRGTMNEQDARFVSGEATNIEWLTGYHGGIKLKSPAA